MEFRGCAAAVAVELCGAIGLGCALAAAEIWAPHAYKAAGLLQSAWPADPVRGRERQAAAAIAEKAEYRQLKLALGRSPASELAYGLAR